MKQFFLFGLVLGSLGPAWSQTSYVAPARVLYEKGHQLTFGVDVFQTSKVANSDGTPHTLSDDESFTRYQGEFLGQYALTRALQVGLGGRFRHHEATFRDNSGDDINASSSGLQSIFTTISFGFAPVGQMSYTLEGLFRFVPYTNDEVTSGPGGNLILGDDGNEYSAGLAVTYSFQSQNFLSARAGYRRPGQDLSDEVYWQAEGALAWKHLALVAGVDGVTSLENDPYEGDPSQRPVFNTGPSALYTSANREWIAPYVGLNIALGKVWRLELKGSQVVNGQSTDIGRSYGLQLIRRVEDYNPSRLVDAKFKTYDIEASVSKVSPKKTYVVIDKGLQDDVHKGLSMDFYEFDYVGGNVLVARGTVVSAKAETAVVKITQRFNKKKQIKEGLLGRASLK